MTHVLLGIDIGTTAVKVLAVSPDSGQTLASVSHPYPTHRPHAGWAEQDPTDWTNAISEAWERISNLLPRINLIAIGVCSQVNTHLLVDEDGIALGPAITWKDLRCAGLAAELDSAISDAKRVEYWGGPFKIDASYSLARLNWWERNQPEVFARAKTVMLPKDFVISLLTGERVADPLSAIGLVSQSGAYIKDVLALVHGGLELNSKLANFDEIAGLTTGALGLPAGVPVAVGTMDAWGNVYGSGLLDSSHAMEVGGTSEIVGILSARSIPTPGVITFPPIRGRHLHAGPTQAGGGALSWFANLHGKTIEESLLAGENSNPKSRLLFLPHLDGERAPYWNPNAQGVWLGVNSKTSFGDLARSVLEGVAYSARQVRASCELAAGGSVSNIRLSGGAGRSRQWNQIKADVHAIPVHLLTELDTGARGIALIAGGAAGRVGDLAQWAASLVSFSEYFEPNPDKVDYYDERFGLYLDSYQSLLPIFDRNSDTEVGVRSN